MRVNANNESYVGNMIRTPPPIARILYPPQKADYKLPEPACVAETIKHRASKFVIFRSVAFQEFIGNRGYLALK